MKRLSVEKDLLKILKNKDDENRNHAILTMLKGIRVKSKEEFLSEKCDRILNKERSEFNKLMRIQI